MYHYCFWNDRLHPKTNRPSTAIIASSFYNRVPVLFHRVVCSMLGYSNGFVLSDRWPGSGTIWLDQVSCRGTERDIADCPHSSWGSHDCSHSEDVSVRCVGSLSTTTTTTARPTGGEDEWVQRRIYKLYSANSAGNLYQSLTHKVQRIFGGFSLHMI